MLRISVRTMQQHLNYYDWCIGHSNFQHWPTLLGWNHLTVIHCRTNALCQSIPRGTGPHNSFWDCTGGQQCAMPRWDTLYLIVPVFDITTQTRTVLSSIAISEVVMALLEWHKWWNWSMIILLCYRRQCLLLSGYDAQYYHIVTCKIVKWWTWRSIEEINVFGTME